MIRTILSISCGIILGVLALSVAAAPEKKERHKPITRLAFLVGANNGGQGRVRLLYSHTDTRAVSKVFQELGGITPGNTHLLLDPSRGDFLRKSTALASTIAALRGSGRQVQVIFYYSGHSDETGLLLGGERLTYKELRKNLKDLKGDVTIAILDSCSSGAVTRAKGGRFVPSFLNSQQDVTRGEVFLTSSSASEAAQESDTIKGSYFTHYMISGLRGAADTSNDQRVTIGEAYQYAFARTLKRTESSQSGPQHPNYAFRLVGSGDLVITELKKTRSKLIIPKAVIGRILVRDSQGNLVSEVEKFGKMPLHIALAPGVYQVTFITGKLVRRGQVVLGRVRVTMFDVNRLRRASTEGARGKGPQDSPVTLVPASLSLFPFMSVNRGFGGRVVNLFSLNLLYEQAWSLSGLEISGLGVLRSGSVRGIQIAGLFNYNEGPTTGLQIGGLLSGTDRDYKGIQIGGVGSVAMGNTTGLQIGGVLDFTLGHLRGAQIAGLANVAGNGGKGLQIGGVTNISGANFTGLQIAGVANITAGD
ncbi:caspase family protein, partial [Myxococcota bacterium]|nr:caspase family protein [Myxococcota bacterium]